MHLPAATVEVNGPPAKVGGNDLDEDEVAAQVARRQPFLRACGKRGVYAAAPFIRLGALQLYTVHVGLEVLLYRGDAVLVAKPTADGPWNRLNVEGTYQPVHELRADYTYLQSLCWPSPDVYSAS